MMDKLRLILLPFSWLYGLIAAIRNSFYTAGILKSYVIPVKSIVVGNLSAGGTGKTPHVEFLIRHYLASTHKIAVLSRGYGRKTRGVLEVTKSHQSFDVGDEPLQYKLKFGEDIVAVVAEKRKNGVEYIMDNHPDTSLIILDDAFQHRAVKAGLNILITSYDKPYFRDFVLPAGNLREWRSGRKRADILVVSKTPELVTDSQKQNYIRRLNFSAEKTFFSHLEYDQLRCIKDTIDKPIENILLVTGIGNPTPLENHLKKDYNVIPLRFPDHHEFSPDDIRQIHEKFDTFANCNKAIVTTEKDLMRFNAINPSPYNKGRWYFQPIMVGLLNENKLKELLNNYAG